jgi:hypothetical protein
MAMNIDDYNIVNDFLSDLLNYINKEKIKIKLSKKSNSELTFESPDQSIKIIFMIDKINHKILYDIYLSNYQKHLCEKTITNFEKMYTLARKHGSWHLPEYLPDTWMILDELHNWTKKTKYAIKGKIIN